LSFLTPAAKVLLTDEEFVLRYETEDASDGLPAGEGAFLARSFWLVHNYILQGRYADANKLFTVCFRAAMTWAYSRKSSIR